jgi:GH35 family endo-1,4-beta-xylanase
MNVMRIFTIAMLFALLFASCNNDDAEENGLPVTAPMSLSEKIIKYDVLKSYTDIKLGVGIGLYYYINDATYRNKANDNFDEVTAGYEMKHGPMVNSTGQLVFGPVDDFVAKVRKAGLSVFGHTLVWHSNQNASYLNGLIAPIENGGGTIERTDGEKAAIIGKAMEDWISKMVTHYKNDVFAWDVVNEPMKDNGELRDGNVANLASDEFYWVKYLGKDYAVTAFNLARQYGNATDKLFVNDYNLEYSMSKCDGLVQYVQYIESKGARVDGIGTQMHISSKSDKDKIILMFQKLAASGKLIKVSELDVRLGTNKPTAQQLADQAAMFQFVVDMYLKYIPENQRYGMTVWGISDNAKEHEYWLPDESPNLWDANYKRKHAYKGFADGLAGRDVSKGF